jgi:glutamyl-tRNA reductase
LEVGKRVRSETDIGTRPMSVAFAGVRLAERIFGSLRGHQALILGAGAMGEQVVEHMRDRGIARVLVANRSSERGQELARRMGGEAVDWDQVSRVLAWPDIVVSSVGGAERVLTRPMVERAMAARANRAMFIIDLGVPRNVEEATGELYSVYLYNIDDLAEIVEQNKKAREGEIPRAEAIIEEHAGKFQAWQASLQAVTLLARLRAKLQHEREEFLRERLDQMRHLSAEERQRIARLAEELLERVLLDPAERLRSARGLRRKLQNFEALRDLFGLDKEEP